MLQLALGTGFKCLSCVWRARRTQRTQHAAWAPAAMDFARRPPGWIRPRALALAAAAEAAEKGPDAPLARTLAALLAAVQLDAHGLEVQQAPPAPRAAAVQVSSQGREVQRAPPAPGGDAARSGQNGLEVQRAPPAREVAAGTGESAARLGPDISEVEQAPWACGVAVGVDAACGSSLAPLTPGRSAGKGAVFDGREAVQAFAQGQADGRMSPGAERKQGHLALQVDALG